ncbi:flagellar hook-basal body protein [Oscillospiraceae bacterium LTW-04]|nr:flagellar hook-basal body protein [Oscillospiraceae bacterium MB24-C1]
MATGFFTAASGMMMQQRTLNVIANNMANANTPGFKTERVVSTTFQQELLMRQQGYNRTFIGSGDAVKVVEDVPTQFDRSLIKATGRPFDLAIEGDGFFSVKDADGKQYLTRNGQFDIDDEGYLVLPGVGRVQGSRGDLKILGSDFSVNSEGAVYNTKGRMVGNLQIVAASPEAELEKFPNGLFQVPGGEGVLGETAGLSEVSTPKIGQGVLEGSNTNYNREVALMMETQRTFQSCSKALMMIDEIEQKAANIASL